MDNAILPYLKTIAEALEKISASGIGSSGATTVGAGDISTAGLDFASIADQIDAGLVTTTTEEQEPETEGEDPTVVTTKTSTMETLREGVRHELHEAFFITVTEEVPVEDGEEGETIETFVEKSVFEVIKDDISEL